MQALYIDMQSYAVVWTVENGYHRASLITFYILYLRFIEYTVYMTVS